jgi:hypothetical protein
VAAFAVVAGAAGLALVLKNRELSQEGDLNVIQQEAISQERLRTLASKRVFFGHQSVGANTLDGLESVVDAHPGTRIDIVKSSEPSGFVDPGIYHFNIGRNARPKSKLDAFRRILDSDSENRIDIAMMKFCYVDLLSGDDPDEVFEMYRETISDLEAKHPEVVFIHWTVPIESARATLRRTVKEGIKNLIGKPGVVEHNQTRQRYNDLLRTEYADREPVFDIARYEAIGPDGKMSYRLVGSEKVFMMDSGYTSDGGHLNEPGRRHIAEQLLRTLTDAAAEFEEVSSP